MGAGVPAAAEVNEGRAPGVLRLPRELHQQVPKMAERRLRMILRAARSGVLNRWGINIAGFGSASKVPELLITESPVRVGHG